MDIIIEKGKLHGKTGWICRKDDIDFKALLPDNNQKLQCAEEKIKLFIMERCDEIDALQNISTITLDRLSNGNYTVRELITLMPTRYGRSKKNNIHYNPVRNELSFNWSYLNIESKLILKSNNLEELRPLILQEIKRIILESEILLIQYKQMLFRKNTLE